MAGSQPRLEETLDRCGALGRWQRPDGTKQALHLLIIASILSGTNNFTQSNVNRGPMSFFDRRFGASQRAVAGWRRLGRFDSRRRRGPGYRLSAVILATAVVTVALSLPERANATEMSSASATEGPPFVYSNNDLFETTKTYNFFNPNWPWQSEPFVVLPLAIQTTKSINSYIPEVATSWKVEGRQLVVHIRPHMLWQNRQPVTSTDVVDSVLLNGVDAAGIWTDITDVQAKGPTEVVFTLAPGVAPIVAESVILGTYIVSSGQYRAFTPPDLTKAVITYYQEQRTDPAAASKSSAGHIVSKDLSRLERFNPSSFIGDGPFKWESWTTALAKLVKSPTFFAAKNIHVPVFELQEVDNNLTEGSILSGNATMDEAGLPPQVYAKELKLPYHRIYTPPAYAQQDLGFNSRHYPLNLTKVRQAIVYILHRPSVIVPIAGSSHSYQFAPYPALLYYRNELGYLTKAQLHSLNPYTYNPAKATQLLKSAGFHKHGGSWYLPSGKRFTLTISGPPYNDVIPDYQLFTEWLNQFGIKTTLETLDEATYGSRLLTGNFELGDEYNGSGYVNPLQFIAATIGSSNDYVSGGADNGDPGLGFGPVMNVPGIGKVNVPKTITAEADQTNYGPKMKKLVWDWARFINQQVPVMSYADRNYAIQFDTVHYVDWPPRSSGLWTLEATHNHTGLVAMMEEGYIRPRR